MPRPGANWGNRDFPRGKTLPRSTDPCIATNADQRPSHRSSPTPWITGPHRVAHCTNGLGGRLRLRGCDGVDSRERIFEERMEGSPNAEGRLAHPLLDLRSLVPIL